MSLLTLLVQNLRIVEHIELSLAADATVFCGENGSGKTSILEAIDFLSRGRSFRNRHLAPLLRAGTKILTVSGNVQKREQTLHLGVQKSAEETILHCNQQKVESIAGHANYLPVVCVHPDSHQLVQGGARQRRSFIDWSVFHVKPKFLPQWRDYNKCLRQRNHLLRHNGLSTADEFAVWTQEISQKGESVNRSRLEIFDEVKPIFEEYARKLIPEGKISISYSRGWPDKWTLEEALMQAHKQEQLKKTTQWGPHRADIKIGFNGNDATLTSSRGQQKLIAASLLLAQIDHAQQQSKQKCVVLLDDIRAELDHTHAHALIAALQALKCQVFISTIEPEQVDLQGWNKTKLFHVKQGACELLA